jgi:dienelactone hydrolase
MKLFFLIVLSLTFSSCASLFSSRHCQVTTTTLNENNTDLSVSVSAYADQAPSSKSLVIFPPTGGTNYIDKKYADEFCSAGYDVFIMNYWSKMNIDTAELNVHDRLYERAQKALTLVLNEIKSPFIGLLGTSAGGLHAMVAASYQERLNAVFVIVTGTPISEVIVTSDQQAMKDLRAEREKKYGFKTSDEIITSIDKVFRFEPSKMPELYKKKTLGMSIATADTTVPTVDQLHLQELWKPTKVITHDSSHFWGIVKTWLFDSGDIVKFFDQSANKVITAN